MYIYIYIYIPACKFLSAVMEHTRSNKKIPDSLTWTVWCIVSSYRLGRVLLAISTCKFCRGCATSGRQGQWSVHHDNAPSHTLLVVQQFLSSSCYSPDLALSDFWLFPTLKMGLKGTRLATMEDIRSIATAELQIST
jgi:hypothetical protein